MRYLLDTNTIVYWLKSKFGVKQKIDEIGFKGLAVSEITLAELYFGAAKSGKKDEKMRLFNECLKEIEVIPFFPAVHIYMQMKGQGSNWLAND